MLPDFLPVRGTGTTLMERHLSYPVCPNNRHLKDSESRPGKIKNQRLIYNNGKDRGGTL